MIYIVVRMIPIVWNIKNVVLKAVTNYMPICMICISNDGFAFDVNGIQKGTIWGMDGCCTAHRHYTNFTNYIDIK
jgi:hypothetical protein